MTDTPSRLADPQWTPYQRRYWGKRLPNSVPKLPEAEPMPPVTASRIIAACAEIGKMSVAELTGGGRRTEILTYRDAAAYLIRKHRNLSLIDVGQRIGRDHSTALHAIRKVETDLSKGGVRFGSVISAVEKKLGV